MSIVKAFERKLSEMIDNEVKNLYPRTWAACRKCGRAFKSAESAKTHEDNCTDDLKN